MPTPDRNHYEIKRVDLSRLLIKSAFELNENIMIAFFEEQAESIFSNKIFNQVKHVDWDELIEWPFESNPVKDSKSGILTFYIVFHGTDESFGDDKSFEETLSFVAVLIDANTGEAYAISTESVD